MSGDLTDLRRAVLGRIRDYEPASADLDQDILVAALGTNVANLHQNKPELSTDVRSAFALAEAVLDCYSLDIETAVRYVSGKRYGRAEICGPRGMGECRSTNEAMALCGAVLAALLNGMGRS